MLTSMQFYVVGLARQGKSPREIHAMLDGALKVGTIHDYLRQARLKGIVLPDFARGRPRGRHVTLSLGGGCADALAQQARERGKTVEALATSLLTALAAEPVLVGNLLDDGDAQ